MTSVFGRRTLAIEMDTGGRLAAMLGAKASIGTPSPVAPNLSVASIDGRVALEEYLGLVIPVKRLLSTIFSSRIYQYFVAAAPGLKELMTVGKVWYEATRKEGDRFAWDAVVVDAPATGHGLQYLRMPQAARDTFGAGLVQREAARVVDLLQDAKTTAVHLVTLAEDMPVTEALEAHAQITGPLGLPAGAVVVNRVHRRRFAAEALAKIDAAAVSAEERPLLRAVAERAVEVERAEQPVGGRADRQLDERDRALHHRGRGGVVRAVRAAGAVGLGIGGEAAARHRPHGRQQRREAAHRGGLRRPALAAHQHAADARVDRARQQRLGQRLLADERRERVRVSAHPRDPREIDEVELAEAGAAGAASSSSPSARR